MRAPGSPPENPSPIDEESALHPISHILICLLLAVAGVAVAEPNPELRTERSITAAHEGADWPTWSGPEGNLTSLGNGVFDGGAFALERVWSRPLGSAYSGILVVDGRLTTAFSDGESDYLVALDASTGAEQWRYRISDVHKGGWQHRRRSPGDADHRRRRGLRPWAPGASCSPFPWKTARSDGAWTWWPTSAP